MNRDLGRMLETATVRLEILLGRMNGCPEGHEVTALEVPAWIAEQRALLRDFPAGSGPQTCPLCEADCRTSTVHLNERFGGGNAGLYLASYWCSGGHEWSVRSKPWGNEQRALLRQAREAMATEAEDV